MKNLLCLVLILAVSVFSIADEAKTAKPVVQIAILLDTSGSMDGLIDQAKTQLWKIVNELATTKKHGQIPELQVALYEYGKSSIAASEGYLRMILPLTTDLDKVSEELFALKTNGGDEYCGWVIQNATKNLSWSKSNNQYKAIFIAGNEPFTQGQVNYKESCQNAIAQGIIVNTIFCGPHAEGISTKWQEGAQLADGSYMNIDQNRKAIQIESPQDKKILELNSKLNSTYIPYGSAGEESQERQLAQDMNAGGSSQEAKLQRAVSKSSALYKNSSWDLVDAAENKDFSVKDLKEDSLPEVMQKMTPKEREAYVLEKKQQRQKIQDEISKLNEERKKFVTKKMQELSASGEDTLDAAMIKALRAQLQKRNYEVGK